MAEVTPYDCRQDDGQLVKGFDRGDRHVRITLALLGLYSACIEHTPSNLQVLALVLRVSSCLIATLCLGVVASTAFTPGEEFNIAVSMKIGFTTIAACMLLCQWYILHKCQNESGFKLYYRRLDECVDSFKKFGSEIPTKLTKVQYFIFIILEINLVVVVVWLILDETLYRESGLTGTDLEQRISDQSARVFIRICGVYQYVNMFTAYINLLMYFYNTSYMTAFLFKLINETALDHTGEMTVQRLRETRHLYNKLCDVVRLADDIWNPIIGIYMILYTVIPLLILSAITSLIQGRYSASIVLLILVSSWVPAIVYSAVMMAYLADYCTNQVSGDHIRSAILFTAVEPDDDGITVT